MLLENHFTLTCCSNDFLWHSESSSAVTLLLHPDWMMLKNSSNQGGANSVTLAPWHTKSRPRMLVASKAIVFLENYFAVSTWILNGSSIECLEKTYQPFSLAGVWFVSRVNQISGLKSANPFYRVRDLKFDRPSINEHEIPDYHVHLLFHSYTVVFFATKFVIGFHAFRVDVFHGIKAGKFNSVFN